MTAQPDDFELYEGTTLGELRSALGWVRSDAAAADVLEPDRSYIAAVVGDAESLLADKYHHFSAVEMILALRMHTDQFQLIWPEHVGWVDHSGPEIAFCSGPNSASSLPLIERLSAQTTFSAIADKTAPTLALRSRAGLAPAQQLRETT